MSRKVLHAPWIWVVHVSTLTIALMLITAKSGFSALYGEKPTPIVTSYSEWPNYIKVCLEKAYLVIFGQIYFDLKVDISGKPFFVTNPTPLLTTYVVINNLNRIWLKSNHYNICWKYNKIPARTVENPVLAAIWLISKYS